MKAAPGLEIPRQRAQRLELRDARMLVPEQRLAAARRGLGRPELLDDVERRGHVLGGLVVERREPVREYVGGQELQHVLIMHSLAYAVQCIVAGRYTGAR